MSSQTSNVLDLVVRVDVDRGVAGDAEDAEDDGAGRKDAGALRLR